MVVNNNGYTLVPPNTYTTENFPGAVQTQVVGINNTGTTVGFYVDGTRANHGFDEMDAMPAATVDNTLTNSTPAFNQLAGVNDANLAAGFYMDAAGNFHGYIATLGSSPMFTPINVTGATSVSATGINNADLVSGFFVDGMTGNTLGFLENEDGTGLVTFEVPGSTMTMFLGLNNQDQAVGSYVDMNGETQGLIYNILNGTFQTISDPNASPMTAFMVNGTTVNGINDAGDLVGFYSDGTHVNGFLAVPAPEPSTLGLIVLPSMLVLCLGWINHRWVISAQGRAA